MPSRRFAGISGVLALSVCTLSCAENDSSMYVAGVMAPPDDCTYKPDPQATRLFGGAMDVYLTRAYRGVVLVGNQLTPRGEKNQLRTETQGVTIRGAEVRLTKPDGSLLDGSSEFSVPASGFIDATTSEAPGYGIAQVTMIPPRVGQRLADGFDSGVLDQQTIVAHVRVFGDTLGGVEITSGDYSFPIEICSRCLISYPSDALFPENQGFRCSGEPEDVVSCGFGQDQLVDCRQCAGRFQSCAVIE